MASSDPLPSTMKALVAEAEGQPLRLQTLATPQPTLGSLVVKLLATQANTSVPSILKGQLPFTQPRPWVPGGVAIGRVAAVGPDTTTLKVGQLVFVENWIRGRDNPDVQILWGLFDGQSPASKKLMKDNWAYGCMSEYFRAPLENTFALNEKRLLGPVSEGGLGYKVEDLVGLALSLIPYAGFRGIDVQAGETVLLAPATGLYSGAGVGVGDAMGINIIAMGRNVDTLKKLQTTYPRTKIVQTTGDVEKDTASIQQWGPVTAYVDISPVQAGNSTHIRSGFLALEQYGRASLMGVITSDLTVPYAVLTWRNIKIQGQCMYDRQIVTDLIRLLESGLLKLGKAGGWDVLGTYHLDDFEQAFEIAQANAKAGQIAVLTP